MILGIGGGVDRITEKRIEFPSIIAHDAAAVLLDDQGEVVAAIEEERLNRIKHSNRAPVEAIRFCLRQGGVQLRDVDKIAVYGNEGYLNFTIKRSFLGHPEGVGYTDARTLILGLLKEEFDCPFPAENLVFVPHHFAHATSAFAMSGFDRSLILTIDGQGDGISGMVMEGQRGNQLQTLHGFFETDSLGFFYLEVIKFLGYDMFDEYKVMGLAPYGDPGKYRELFKKFYNLLPNGNYKINFPNLNQLFEITLPRMKNEPFSQTHQDLAAALQEALEEIVIHVLTHYRSKTNQSRFCLAGGVAHNCSMNGKILYSGMFEEIFIQPAAHDAGSVLGAALYVHHKNQPAITKPQLKHVYWGSDIGDNAAIETGLEKWGLFLDFQRLPDIVGQAAQLMADGSVLGWAQGRSEFGPRALGNRSIVADPRPAENRKIINEMVKTREAYRPFAPSVLEEVVDEYFDIPGSMKKFPFMIFVVKVRPEKRQLLGAITHIDGTARIQTVSRETNPRYWELIAAFGKLTGVPIILNTSFNNNVEPIVDSLTDAIVCYLTTKLHYLVVGDFLVSKKKTGWETYLGLKPSFPLYAQLVQVQKYTSSGRMEIFHELHYNYHSKYTIPITPEMNRLLSRVDGVRNLDALLSEAGFGDAQIRERLITEISDLWTRRIVKLEP